MSQTSEDKTKTWVGKSNQFGLNDLHFKATINDEKYTSNILGIVHKLCHVILANF